eukprot:359240-Chlamydomonas_euryale.AAC.19
MRSAVAASLQARPDFLNISTPGSQLGLSNRQPSRVTIRSGTCMGCHQYMFQTPHPSATCLQHEANFREAVTFDRLHKR